MKMPTAFGRYAPLRESHEVAERRINTERNRAPLIKGLEQAAKEVSDRRLATPAEPPKEATKAETAKQPEGPAAAAQPPSPPQAVASEQSSAKRPDQRHFRPGLSVHGLGPAGDEIHTIWGRMRAVRQAQLPQPATTQTPDKRNSTEPRHNLRAEAEKLFKDKSQLNKADIKEGKDKSEGKDGGKEIEI